MTTRSMVVPAKLDEVEPICGAIDEEAVSAGFDEHTNYACQLAVCEAFENIVIHGYRGKLDGQVAIKITARPGELVVQLDDSAPPFNPATAPPDTPAVHDPPAGGLGLRIMHRVMDEIEYQRRPAGNTLTMRKVQDKADSP